MASLASISLKRPVLAIVLNVLILVFGGIGFTFLGVREFPSIDPPIINVRTSYTGANADIIETQITEPLEKAINGIAGIKNISSSSNQGASVITVEFDLDVDLEAAANDVRDKVSQAVRQLPQDIDAPPVVSKQDANSDAIVAMTVQSSTRNHMQVTDYAVNVIQERLQTIPGVSTVQIWGEKRYAMRLWMDPAKLASYKLTPLDIFNALNKENVELPSGKITGNATELTVKTVGKLVTEDEFNNLILKVENGNVIRFKDVGYARLGPENEETILRENGVPMVGLALVPQPGSNYIDIADEFYRRYEQLKTEMPKDIYLDIALDNTTFIRNSIHEVQETIFIAFFLVVIIIYLFFRDWLIALRPLIDIPVSLIGAFFIMYLFGFTINVLTLLAIVLATGLVVDDGIVVTENIYKKLEGGMNKFDAAEKGTNEIYFAVISTSLTLAAVFLPVIFLQGFVGALFREFGIVIAGAVLISAFVSLTLTPVLNLKLTKSVHKHSKFYTWSEPFFVWMVESYRKSLNSFMKYRKPAAFGIIGLSIALILLIYPGLKQELAPLEDRSSFRVSLTAPEGASFEYMDAYIKKMVGIVQDSVPEREVLISVTSPGFTGSGAANTGFMRIALNNPDERNRSQEQIINSINPAFNQIPDGRAFIIQEQTISSGGGPRGGLPVQFVLQNSDFEKLRTYLPKFLSEVRQDSTFLGVDVNLKFNKPELNVTINREKANELGVSVADISQTLQLAFSGRRFGYFNMTGKQYQVIGQVDRENREQPLDLKSIYVRSQTGELVQLDNLVNIVEESSPPQLYHYDRYRSATISAGLAPGKTLGDGINSMYKIADKVLDESFTTALSGPSRDFAESSSNTNFAFLFALLLVYLLLAAQFESFIDPLMIMITVPLALAGALLSLWYFNQTINIFSQIGIIMLIGLVTKNGILIVEFANQLRESGMNKIDAAVESAAMRLRPILMTSLATALGALPIALALGAGAQSRIPMGIVIVGGIMFSLILTLYVIPAIYSLFSRGEHRGEHIEKPINEIETENVVLEEGK